MGTTLENAILAIVTTSPEKVGGGCPIFYASDKEDLQATAFALEKMLDAVAHEIKPDILIVVRH